MKKLKLTSKWGEFFCCLVLFCVNLLCQILCQIFTVCAVRRGARPTRGPAFFLSDNCSYEMVDDRHKTKRTDLRGQFVYAALLDFGQEEKYIATIKLDDTASDKRALFKDISIKKGSLYAGQTQNSTSVNAPLPADPNITIQQLVDFVKSDFSDSPLFADKIPQKSNLLLRLSFFQSEVLVSAFCKKLSFRSCKRLREMVYYQKFK